MFDITRLLPCLFLLVSGEPEQLLDQQIEREIKMESGDCTFHVSGDFGLQIQDSEEIFEAGTLDSQTDQVRLIWKFPKWKYELRSKQGDLLKEIYFDGEDYWFGEKLFSARLMDKAWDHPVINEAQAEMWVVNKFFYNYLFPLTLHEGNAKWANIRYKRMLCAKVREDIAHAVFYDFYPQKDPKYLIPNSPASLQIVDEPEGAAYFSMQFIPSGQNHVLKEYRSNLVVPGVGESDFKGAYVSEWQDFGKLSGHDIAFSFTLSEVDESGETMGAFHAKLLADESCFDCIEDEKVFEIPDKPSLKHTFILTESPIIGSVSLKDMAKYFGF